MKQFCDEWERCMKRDASVVGRAKVAAETLAEVVNGFVEPITWKTLVCVFTLSTPICDLIYNRTFHVGI